MTAGDSALARARLALFALTPDELRLFHREVAREAAKIYAVTHKARRDANYATAMAIRDTRFVKGLSPLENTTRCAKSWAGQ